ncbi:DMT family transporter [Prolixibacter sp. SD074]|uniref:DMT family transporter n=1 Tax=Prolixibacter sp. SD074 TaxID=2652391 RepID=UPI001E61135D|nr:DMT family transporter [Prolixibacter sp. SD074]
MKKTAIIAGLLSGFLFGVATPFSKLLLAHLNSFQLAGLLYLGAGIAMIPSIMKTGGQIKLLFSKSNLVRTSGIILFGGLLGPLLLLVGLRAANAASVSIWLNMELVATAVLGVLFFKDSLDKFTWIGVILTVFAGVATSFGEGVSGLTSALLITAACFCWGIDNHLTALTDGATPQAVTFVKGLMAGIVNLAIGVSISASSIAFNIVAAALIVGGFSYGFSIVLYVISAQNIGATRGQILFATAPLWGVILSYIFFQDSFHWTHVISLLLLILAVVVINMISHKHQHTHEMLEHIHYHKHNDEHHDHSHDDESINPAKGHSHMHTHQSLTHTHPHYPDLHHRHKHE